MTNPIPSDEPRARRRAATPNNYREAQTHLELAAEAQEPDARIAHATLAAAHAGILQANELRVSNLIDYLAVLRSARQLSPRGLALIGVIESRIDAALGTDEIQVETDGADGA